MIELIRTADPVLLSVLRAALADADIDHQLFDSGAGGLWQAAIPVRIMVRDEELELARRVVAQLEL